MQNIKDKGCPNIIEIEFQHSNSFILYLNQLLIEKFSMKKTPPYPSIYIEEKKLKD